MKKDSYEKKKGVGEGSHTVRYLESVIFLGN